MTNPLHQDDDHPTVEPVAMRLDHTGRLVAIGHTITGCTAEVIEPPRWREMNHPEDHE